MTEDVDELTWESEEMQKLVTKMDDVTSEIEQIMGHRG